MSGHDDLRAFIAEEAAFERSVGTQARQASWDFSISGDPALQERMRELMLRRREHYADAERFARLEAWRNTGLSDGLLRRQVDLLWRDYLSAQEDAGTREELVRLTAEQQGLFNRFRATLDGKLWSENDLNDALADVTDSARAQALWEASKQIGVEAEDRALRLVKVRNRAAQEQGFRDAYARGLALAEVDEARLLALLDDLARASEQPYRLEKARIDAELSQRFGIPVDALRPWHYGDPFFQRPPRATRSDIEREFADKEPEPLALAACDSIGLESREVLRRSDLLPKPGKNQHAFCTTVAPDGSDVRVLCNLTKSHRWTSTLLHELGHALAAEYADRSLPQRLQLWPNSIIAETESQTIERMASDARWLREVVGVPSDRADQLAADLKAQARLQQLILTRWCLVMAHFERALYVDPDADLPALWWDLVERYQLLKRPEGRNGPDWAAKIHLANFPGNYYAYILGEMVVSQLHAAIVRDVGGLYGHPAAGRFLVERLYRLGSTLDWEGIVERATGERLTADAYVTEWFAVADVVRR